MPRTLIDLAAVKARLGGRVTTSTVYRMMARGDLPRPLKAGARFARWDSDEIDRAVERMAQSREEAKTDGET